MKGDRNCPTCIKYLKPRWDCPDCGGTGKIRGEKMIESHVILPIVVENEEKCHPDCKGRYCDHDGNMLCHYFDDNLEFVDGGEDGRCKACKEQYDPDMPWMDKWVTKDVVKAVKRLGHCMLDFSINDFEDAGFSQQALAKTDGKDPVFTIDLAIALLKSMKERQ